MPTVPHHQSLHHQVSRILTFISFICCFQFIWSRTPPPPFTTHKFTERLLLGGFWLFRMSGWQWRGLNRWFRMQSVVVVGEYDTCGRENSHALLCPAEITCRKERKKQLTFSDSSLAQESTTLGLTRSFSLPLARFHPRLCSRRSWQSQNERLKRRNASSLKYSRRSKRVGGGLVGALLRRCAKSNLWQRLTGVNKGWRWCCCCWWWWGAAGDCEDEYNSGILKRVIWTSLQYIEHARNCAAVH